MRSWRAHKARLRALAFSPDARLIATTSGNSKFVWLWDATTGELVRKLAGHTSHARAVAFTADGRHVAAADNAGRARVWEVGGPLTATLMTGERWLGFDGLALTPDGRWLFAPYRNTVYSWSDPTTPAADARRPDGQLAVETWAANVAVSPDGNSLALVGVVATTGRACVYLMHRPTSARTREFPDPLDRGASPGAFAFAPDGSRLVVAFGYRAACWSLTDPEAPAVVLKGHTQTVRAVGFTPDGSAVLTAGCDGTVRVWDAVTGAERRTFAWGVGNLYVAAFAPDGLTAAAGTDDGHLIVWDVDV